MVIFRKVWPVITSVHHFFRSPVSKYRNIALYWEEPELQHFNMKTIMVSLIYSLDAYMWLHNPYHSLTKMR